MYRSTIATAQRLVASIVIAAALASASAAQHAPFPARPGSGFHRPAPSAEARLPSASIDPAAAFQIESVWRGTPQTAPVDPPDVHGAVGPKGILEINNLRVAYRLKDGGVFWIADRLFDFFPLASNGILVDPKAVYDPASGRFFAICILANYTGSSPSLRGQIYLAVSRTSHPQTSTTSDWFFHVLDVTETIGGENYGPDYPGIGYDASAVYLTANMISMPFTGSAHFANCAIVVLNKSLLIQGIVSMAVVHTPNQGVGDIQRAFTLQPVSPVGPTTPSNLEYFAEVPYYSATDRIRLWALSDPLGARVLRDTILIVPNHGGLTPLAPQCASDAELQTMSNRAQGNAFWHSGEVWFCHTGWGPSFQSSVYYQVVATHGFPAGPAQVVESGRLDGPPGIWLHQPAIAGNALGDVCLVYTQSGSSQCPQIAVTARRPTDSGFGPPALVWTSITSRPGNAGYAPWGDYGVAAVDPADQSFWVSHEIADGNDTRFWGTVWSNVTVPRPATGWPGSGRLVRGVLTRVEDTAVLADGLGGAILAWRDRRDDFHAIHALKLTSNGELAAGWRYNGFQVSSPLSGEVEAPQMAPDGAGGAFVGFARIGVKAWVQRITADGAIAAGWPAGGVVVGTGVERIRIAAAGDGGVLVTWTAGGVKAQKLSATGSPLWGTSGVAVASGFRPEILADGAGGAFVTYDASGVKVQRLSSAGVPMWSGPTAVGAGLGARSCSDGAGGVYLVFSRTVAGNGADLYASRVTGAGAIAPGWPSAGLALAAFPGDQTQAVIAPDGAAGALIAWSDARDHAEENLRDVYLQRLGPSSAPASGWPAFGAPVCTADGTQTAPALVPDGNGGAIVLWQDRRAAASCTESCPDDVYGTHFRSNGVRDAGYPANGRPFATLAGVQGKPVVAVTSPVHAIAAWEDGRHLPDCDPFCPTAIYAQRFAIDTAAPTAVSEPMAALGIAFDAPRPNPAASGTLLAWDVPPSLAGERMSLDVFDVGGRRVRTVVRGAAPAGRSSARWDLSGPDGARVRGGVYFVELTIGTAHRRRTLIVP